MGVGRYVSVTRKITVSILFSEKSRKLNACANSVYQAFPPPLERLGTRLEDPHEQVSVRDWLKRSFDCQPGQMEGYWEIIFISARGELQLFLTDGLMIFGFYMS